MWQLSGTGLYSGVRARVKGTEAARARLPDVVELPVEDAHGARRRLVLEAAPVADGDVVHQRLLQLRQVYPPPEASAAK